jgi:hypothetical protein
VSIHFRCGDVSYENKELAAKVCVFQKGGTYLVLTHLIIFTLFVKYDVIFCTSAYFLIEQISDPIVPRMKILYSCGSN